MKIRDRITELRRVKASELTAHPKNWRKHGQAQQDAMRGILAEVGYADALIARETPEGTLELLDGHLRASITPDEMVPVLILDVSAEEGELILASHDPLAAMAEVNEQALGELLHNINTDSQALADMLTELAEASNLDLDGEAIPEPENQEEWHVVKFTPDQWSVIGVAVKDIQESEGDSTIKDGRAIELMAADWRAGG